MMHSVAWTGATTHDGAVSQGRCRGILTTVLSFPSSIMSTSFFLPPVSFTVAFYGRSLATQATGCVEIPSRTPSHCTTLANHCY